VKTTTPLSELISLKGKKVLVTGSAAGIGKAMAYRFAEAGAALELADMNREGLRIVKKELSQLAPEVNIHKVDISKKEQIDYGSI
jgi:NAD(P)-dependent dehydrogenase (short-subunit alcohol dehydrogenase family)